MASAKIEKAANNFFRAKKLLNDAKNGKKSNHVKVFSSLKIWR